MNGHSWEGSVNTDDPKTVDDYEALAKNQLASLARLLDTARENPSGAAGANVQSIATLCVSMAQVYATLALAAATDALRIWPSDG